MPRSVPDFDLRGGRRKEKNLPDQNAQRLEQVGISGANAIHDNVEGEINAIDVKGTPVDADVIVIEDSEASFAKKKATLGSLIPDHNDLNGLNDGTDYEHITQTQKDALHTTVVAGDLNHNDLTNIDAGDIKHLTAAQVSALHPSAHNIVSHSDTTATGAELNILTAGGETALHSHAGGDKTRTIKMELLMNNGSVYASYGIDMDAEGEGFSMSIKLPANLDGSKNIYIIYNWKAQVNRSTFQAHMRYWISSIKTDNTEAVAWNIANNQEYWMPAQTSGRGVKYIFTIAANIQADDNLLMLCRFDQNSYSDRLLYNAKLRYEVV